MLRFFFALVGIVVSLAAVAEPYVYCNGMSGSRDLTFVPAAIGGHDFTLIYREFGSFRNGIFNRPQISGDHISLFVRYVDPSPTQACLGMEFRSTNLAAGTYQVEMYGTAGLVSQDWRLVWQTSFTVLPATSTAMLSFDPPAITTPVITAHLNAIPAAIVLAQPQTSPTSVTLFATKDGMLQLSGTTIPAGATRGEVTIRAWPSAYGDKTVRVYARAADGNAAFIDIMLVDAAAPALSPLLLAALAAMLAVVALVRVRA